MLLLSSPNSQQILLTNILCITHVSSRVYFHVMAVNQKIANIEFLLYQNNLRIKENSIILKPINEFRRHDILHSM